MSRRARRAIGATLATLAITAVTTTQAAYAGSCTYLKMYADDEYLGTLYGQSSVKTLSNGDKVGWAKTYVRNVWLPFGEYAKITTAAGSHDKWCYGGGDCYVTVAAGGSTAFSVKGVHKVNGLVPGETFTLKS